VTATGFTISVRSDSGMDRTDLERGTHEQLYAAAGPLLRSLYTVNRESSTTCSSPRWSDVLPLMRNGERQKVGTAIAGVSSAVLREKSA